MYFARLINVKGSDQKKLAVVTNLSEVLKQELKKASNIFFIAQHETPSGRNQVLARLHKSAASGNPLTGASNSRTSTLGTRGFCRVRRELSLLAEGARKKPENRARKVSGTQGTILANALAFVKTSLVLDTFLSTFSRASGSSLLNVDII